MNANSIIAVGYLRLSREEATAGESSSIKTQRTMITDYCNRQESISSGFTQMTDGREAILIVPASKK